MERFHKGISGSRRIASGKAVVFLKSNIIIPRYTIKQDVDSIENEIEKLETALLKTKNQLEDVKNELLLNKSSVETGYLDSTILMLEDPMIREKVTKKIRESYLNIEWIFNEVIEEMASKLQDSDIHYFKERAPDVISIGHRVLKNLLGDGEKETHKIGSDSIIIAHTLSPPEVVSFYKQNIKAIVTEIGGRTSHVTIMAQDLKIPAVIGVENITEKVQTGDSVIVDGTAGTVIVEPEKDTERLYKFKEKHQRHYESNLRKIQKKHSLLKEGVEIHLLANMDLEEELSLVKHCGCTGIGLFRTEYIFLNRKEAPNEEEQLSIYRNVFEGISPYVVTIRIIDIGGDKKPPYLDYYKESNPFLGLRGIRFALSHLELLKPQIKAILRAANLGNARMMFPMVSDLDEFLEILKVIETCKQELSEQQLPFKEDIQIGVMVETPSSVILLDKFASHVDFISVGTNDLIQYTLAIDRGNGMVASKFDPLHPAILRSLHTINRIASENGLETSICGEMAGDPLYTLLLIGLGYRILSMSTINIPTVKNIVINSSLKEANMIASRALEFSSKDAISKFIRKEMVDRFIYIEDFFR